MKVLFALFLVISAQTVRPARLHAESPGNSPPEDGKKNFVFVYTDNQPWKNLNDYSTADERVFSSDIARQISLLDHTYLVFSGKDDDRPNVIKPDLYGALSKLKHYYKGVLKDYPDKRNEILQEYSHILLKGYVCYSEDTAEIEQLLSRAKSPSDIISAFNQITIKSP